MDAKDAVEHPAHDAPLDESGVTGAAESSTTGFTDLSANAEAVQTTGGSEVTPNTRSETDAAMADVQLSADQASTSQADPIFSVEDELRDLIAPVPVEHVSITRADGSPAIPAGDSQNTTYKAELSATETKPETENEQQVQGIPAVSEDTQMDGVIAHRDSNMDTNGMNIEQTGEPEWEIDSSPYESSSVSSSSDSSDDDSDEDDDPDYAMLDPAEAARILMQGDAGSDDEGPSRGSKTAGAAIRSVNEKPEEVIPKPDIVVTEDMAVEELGFVEAAVEGTVLVKAKTSGEYQVLETGSVLCLKDRSVIGVIADTFGRVEQPMYTIRFTNDDAIKEAGLAEKGTSVYYVQQHSTFVFTQPLKTLKGSDASNVNDEEVGDDEKEFSDDEAEAEWKRQKKEGRQNRRDARNGPNGASRSTKPNGSTMYDDTPEINYDDADAGPEDGYTPLARPSNLHEMIGRKEPPTEGRSTGGSSGSYRPDNGRGRGDFRGGRGRGRGDRGRGGRDRRNDYSSRINEQRGYHGAPSQNSRTAPPAPTWPQQGQFGGTYGHNQQGTYQLPQNAYGNSYQMPHLQGSQPLPIPQPPSLTPQNPQYPSFSPSPISPLPMSQFQWPNMSQPHQQQSPTPQQQSPPGLGMPPPGVHLNPNFFNQPLAPYGQQDGGQANSAAFAQVQAQLDMLRRFGPNFQQNGSGGGQR